MGISVKGRSRKLGSENVCLLIKNDNFDKLESACKVFNCIPYFAFILDASNTFSIFILKKEKLLKMFPMGKVNSAWKMGANKINEYKSDKDIIIIEFKYETVNWWI